MKDYLNLTLMYVLMYMSDYITLLDNILSSTGEPLLVGAGSVSHHQAMEKAEME